MKYTLNESVRLVEGGPVLLPDGPAVEIRPGTTASLETTSSTDTSEPTANEFENTKDFARAFADLEARYAGKSDQASMEQYEQDINSLWEVFFKQTFKGVEGPAGEDLIEYLHTNIAKPLKLEVKEYGYTEQKNPFIKYLKTVFAKHIFPRAVQYASIHNALLDGKLTTKDLRAVGQVGLDNIIFSPDLFTKSATDFNRYLTAQKQLISKISNDEELKSDISGNFKTNMYTENNKLKSLDALNIKEDEATFDTAALSALPEKDRNEFVNYLLTQFADKLDDDSRTRILTKMMQASWDTEKLNMKKIGTFNKLMKNAGITVNNLEAVLKKFDII